MSFVGNIFVTPHAVRRYSERVKESDYEAALAALIDQFRRAHFVKTRPSGVEVWRGPKPLRLRMIVGNGTGRCPALLTILGGRF